MVDASELLDSGARTPIGSDLLEGLKAVALNQKISFRLYGRVVLPLDGFVFFVRADLLALPTFQAQALATAPQLVEVDMRPRDLQTPSLLGLQEEDTRPRDFEALGSLHYATDVRQDENETYAASRVVFTSTDEVQEFLEIAPDAMWIGEFDDLRFGFSSLSARYRQAGLWHYQGFAIYPDIAPQVIDRITDFSTAQVVSNSLPAWLAIAAYRPVYAFWTPLPPLFPSFLAPLNQPPPFATVHILPETTRALAAAPTLDHATQTHTQLCSESVRVTLWGARNEVALGFVDAVNQYSLDTGRIGIMNIPVVRDEKRTQAELGVIAQKKIIDFEVSYLQHQVRAIAIQQIKSAIPSFSFG